MFWSRWLLLQQQWSWSKHWLLQDFFTSSVLRCFKYTKLVSLWNKLQCIHLRTSPLWLTTIAGVLTPAIGRLLYGAKNRTQSRFGVRRSVSTATASRIRSAARYVELFAKLLKVFQKPGWNLEHLKRRRTYNLCVTSGFQLNVYTEWLKEAAR